MLVTHNSILSEETSSFCLQAQLLKSTQLKKKSVERFEKY